jgi:hypothetical protein
MCCSRIHSDAPPDPDFLGLANFNPSILRHECRLNGEFACQPEIIRIEKREVFSPRDSYT